MNTLRKINKNYKQSLSVIIILFFADLFSFVTAKTFSQVYKETPIYIPISFELLTDKESKSTNNETDPTISRRKNKIRCNSKNKMKLFNNLKLNNKSVHKNNKVTCLKETSENLILDIMPIILIGCIILARKKDLFELKYNF